MHAIPRFARLTLLNLALPTFALAQNDPEPKITVQPVRGHVSMLLGRGGNIGASVGPDGVILIDDQFAPMTDKIVQAVASLTDKPIRFVINTHWHDDHTGGNENLGKAGATIVAHENVRKQMSVEHVMRAFNRTIPPAPPAALPVVTFPDSLTLHLNGDETRVIHVRPAHTDGDSLVHFVQANVLHMGDLYFNGMYPFIDTSTGGSIDGVIAAVDVALKLVNDETKIIPGHGPLSGVAELRDYQAMLKVVADKLRPMVQAGKSRDEVIAAKPTAELDAKWADPSRSFLKPDIWVGIVYDGLAKKK